MELATTLLLCIGSAFFIAAATASLLGRTDGLPPDRRAQEMARIVVSAMKSCLPYRRTVAAVFCGAGAFSGTLLVGLAVTILIVRLIPREVPHPTEAYEGFGDAMTAMFFLGTGAVLSLCMAVIVGTLVGMSRAEQSPRNDRPPKPSNSEV